MAQRTLGTNGPVVNAIGLGCMGFSQGYGAADDDTSVRAIRTALDAGVTLLDTAQSYGSGHNEQLVGRAIAGRRGDVVVATKFGIVRRESGVALDAHPDRVRAYCEASLGRLGIDAIDLYYLHRVDPAVPITETIGAMAELVDAGLVRHLGVSEVSPTQLDAAGSVHPIAAVQFEWSLAWREPEDDIVPAARRQGTGLVPYSPLSRGLLTGALPSGGFAAGDFRRDDPRLEGDCLARNLEAVGALARTAAGRGATPAQLALAWLVAQGDDVVPIPGSRRPERVREAAGAGDLELDAAELARLEAAVPRDAWVGDRRSFAAHRTERATAGG